MIKGIPNHESDILIWNVRGLNSHIKQREVIVVFNKNKSGLVVMLETKLQLNKLGVCHRRYFS